MTTPRPVKSFTIDGGRWLWWLGHPESYLALGSETDDAYTVLWGSARPGASPPAHSHTFDEGFYVLSGEMEFRAGRETVRLGAGGFVQIRAGTAHCPTVVGTEPADCLCWCAPAGFDRFQMEVGRGMRDRSDVGNPPTAEDFARLAAAAPRYGIDLKPSAEALAAEPEVTVRQPGTGHRIAAVGDVYTFLATGEDTGGRYALWHALVQPGGGPPPHIHSREEEAFYVLSGELVFYDAGKQLTAGPGTLIQLPKGSLHWFRNESSVDAEMLVFVAPAGLEKMFEYTGQPWPDAGLRAPPPSHDELERLKRVAPDYGIELRLSH